MYISLRASLCTNISHKGVYKLYECVCAWDQCVGCAPDAWLTGPSKEWSWYKQAWLFPRLCLHWETPEQHYQSTGFPLQSELAHYSSLSHTETITHKHTHTVHRHGGTVYMHQSGNSPTHMLLKHFCCCIFFPLRLSLRPFSYCKHSTQSHQTNADLSFATLLQTLLKAL